MKIQIISDRVQRRDWQKSKKGRHQGCYLRLQCTSRWSGQSSSAESLQDRTLACSDSVSTNVKDRLVSSTDSQNLTQAFIFTQNPMPFLCAQDDGSLDCLKNMLRLNVVIFKTAWNLMIHRTILMSFILCVQEWGWWGWYPTAPVWLRLPPWWWSSSGPSCASALSGYGCYCPDTGKERQRYLIFKCYAVKQGEKKNHW